MADRFEKDIEQCWNYWKNHELVVLEEGEHVQAYYLKHPKQARIEGCLLLFNPEGIVITGDCVPGSLNAVGSVFGYSQGWFGKDLSSYYLASKFLRQKWQRKFAVEELRESLKEEEAESNPSNLPITDLNHLADELDEWGFTEESFYDELSLLDWDTSDGLPGYDYDPDEFGLLIVIQRRFAELWKKRTIEEKNKVNPEPLLDTSRDMSPTPFHVGFMNRGHGHGDYGILDNDKRLVAEMKTIYQQKEARLLAAAPEMLEELKGVVKRMTNSSDDIRRIQEIIDKVDQKKN